MRALLVERGAMFRFDTKVEGFLTRGGGERGAIRGLKLAGGGEILADRCGVLLTPIPRPPGRGVWVAAAFGRAFESSAKGLRRQLLVGGKWASATSKGIGSSD